MDCRCVAVGTVREELPLITQGICEEDHIVQQKQNIKIDNIELDPDNPRIKQFVTMYPELNEARMFLALGAGSDHFEGGGILVAPVHTGV